MKEFCSRRALFCFCTFYKANREEEDFQQLKSAVKLTIAQYLLTVIIKNDFCAYQ